MHLDNSEGRCRFSHAEWSWFPSRDTLVRYPDPLCAHSFLVYSVEMHGAQRRGSPAVSVQQLHSTETKSKSSRLKDSTALLSRPSGNSFVSTILTSYFYVVCGTNITSCPECGHICSKKVFWLHSLNHFFFFWPCSFLLSASLSETLPPLSRNVFSGNTPPCQQGRQKGMRENEAIWSRGYTSAQILLARISHRTPQNSLSL